jgi:hypothetical protein
LSSIKKPVLAITSGVSSESRRSRFFNASTLLPRRKFSLKANIPAFTFQETRRGNRHVKETPQ